MAKIDSAKGSPLYNHRLAIAYSFSSRMPNDRIFNERVEEILASLRKNDK